MATPKLKVTALALFTLASCSQILGLDDYSTDPSLDPASGGDGSEGGDGNSGGSRAGSDSKGGEPGMAGEPGMGGSGAGQTGSGGASEAGAGGEAGQGPMVIPCDSTDCCDKEGGIVEETELLPNGDFETGRAQWTASSKNEYEVFTKQSAATIDANSGSWFAWIGGNQNDLGIVFSPRFTIPSDTGWLAIAGYRLLAFDSLAMTGDYARVDMFDADGDFELAEEPFFYWDNSEFDTNSWQLFAWEVPLGEYTGTEHQIGVVGVTDALWDVDENDPDDQIASNFFFDDLSFKALKCVPRE
jgi:hypothetical protein